ncbi:FUN14 domain-containing protein [Nitrososphaera sp. AFS]|uniref:FUN14 domain-containing protein n=1 Tax=Nitrososphaera sp. AFS TaxID=2301191 RepID=UPI001392268D|nr:FUN14 domain-containing protein [Nitrososphaera sp. AFS]NAL78270.1 hypothetical protein [Nitrososphaera sp. AFS]
MNIEHISPVAMAVGGFLSGILIGYALKKVVKLVAVVVGLFFAGLACLQYQQILNINWNKLQTASQNTLSTLANSTMQIPGFSSDHTAALSNLGIPLAGSLSMGIAIGFLKG